MCEDMVFEAVLKFVRCRPIFTLKSPYSTRMMSSPGNMAHRKNLCLGVLWFNRRPVGPQASSGAEL